MSGYAELAAATNFSFLHGASHPSDMVAAALELGHSGIGIADRNTVAGVVRAHRCPTSNDFHPASAAARVVLLSAATRTPLENT